MMIKPQQNLCAITREESGQITNRTCRMLPLPGKLTPFHLNHLGGLTEQFNDCLQLAVHLEVLFKMMYVKG